MAIACCGCGPIEPMVALTETFVINVSSSVSIETSASYQTGKPEGSLFIHLGSFVKRALFIMVLLAKSSSYDISNGS